MLSCAFVFNYQLLDRKKIFGKRYFELLEFIICDMICAIYDEDIYDEEIYDEELWPSARYH